MDSIRNIISNLYIYKYQNVDNLNMNKFGKKYLPEDSPSKEETMEKINQEITTNNNQMKTNKNIYVNININNRTKNPRLDNYNQKYISLKSNNFLKNDVNYVVKNKELIREQENMMKELKLKKENEAMNLLLNNRARNNSDVRSKLYDYELKQKKERMKLLKKKGIKLRNLSSKIDLQRNNSQYKLLNNNNNNNNNINNNYINENNYNQINPQISENINKQSNDFAKSVKLPRIQVKPSSSPMLDGVPLLHKDFGKMPEYLEKRKQELKEAKELEILKQKEKNLPSGYKILSEEERQERLNSLKNQKRELEEELFKLPIARLSMKQKKTKETLEKTLFDIEEKIYKLIGYKEVIVKNEE